ncbi:MAG: ATP-binding cassette domain-containing protein [Ruminiclostridium sp.]|nr:ATP-binding cassette domain-containing protein [Ruminiclostridium sp.]
MSLIVQNLSKSFNGHVAVRDLSFEFAEPGVFAFLGTNGAGKSTSIRMILNMLKKDSGTVLWNGRELNVLEENIGYLSEERGLYPKYNVLEQMYYFASLKGMKKAQATAAIDYLFDRLRINEYRKKKAEQLSKGNQQKVQLAAALISNPKLIILDEPLSGLDPVNADLFKEIIREERDKGKYIIMSSHQMATIEEFCEDLVLLHRGEVVLQGNLNKIKKDYGRVNLTVKADGEFLDIAEECGLVVVEDTPNGTDFKVKNEAQAQELLRKMLDKNINVVTFDLREPSLHELFVEKCGGDAVTESAGASNEN